MIGKAITDFQSKLNTASETYLHPTVLGKRLAGLVETLLEDDEDKIQATGETICDELGIDIVTEPTEGIVTEPTEGEPVETAGPSTAHLQPFQSPTKRSIRKGSAVPLLRKNKWKNNTHKKRCKKAVRDALDKCESMEHACELVHNVCTEGKYKGIGARLGLLHFTGDHQSVLDHMWEDVMEVLHCDLCIGKNTNDSLTFQHNAFNLIAPSAPKDEAPAEEWRE